MERKLGCGLPGSGGCCVSAPSDGCGITGSGRPWSSSQGLGHWSRFGRQQIPPSPLLPTTSQPDTYNRHGCASGLRGPGKALASPRMGQEEPERGYLLEGERTMLQRGCLEPGRESTFSAGTERRQAGCSSAQQLREAPRATSWDQTPSTQAWVGFIAL